ncbi:hypothetical protein JCM3774_000482 [Rhodotorula dairenensis]
MNSGLVQTALLIAAPYLLPKVIRVGQSFLNPKPKGQRNPVHTYNGPSRDTIAAADSPRLAAFRLFVCALGLSLCVFSALNPPENLFLSLSPPHSFLSRLFPCLRHPLDIRLATETLSSAWSRTLLRRPLAEPELALLARLQTLDARLVYVAYGAGPLMHCMWCRSPGVVPTGSVFGLDYALALLPLTGIAYLVTLAGCGLLLSGNGRARFRSWIVVLLLGGMAAEVWARLTWDSGRGQTAVGAPIAMIHSQIHVLRSLFFASLVAVSYLAPATRRLCHAGGAPPPPGTSTIITPALVAIAQQSESALHRLRALSVARMAVLHDDRFRKEVTDFWTSASCESRLARSDPAVLSALETRLRGSSSSSSNLGNTSSSREGREEGPGPSASFAAWVEQVTCLPEDWSAREQQQQPRSPAITVVAAVPGDEHLDKDAPDRPAPAAVDHS